MFQLPQNKTEQSDLTVLTADFLKSWPLPQPDQDGDKEERGRVLVIGGASVMPGAVILAATAALRAGAGKLQIGTGQSIYQAVGVAVPEALVFPLPETKTGGIDKAGIDQIVQRARQSNALLIGPGMVDPEAVARVVPEVIAQLDLEKTVVILDAEGFSCLKDLPGLFHKYPGQGVITPHAGEMAGLLGIDKAEIQANPAAIAQQAAEYFQSVVVLKGATTIIARPGGEIYCNNTGNVGLATSGSGDTLSGIIAGLAARGAPPIQAAAWAVFLHGSAGEQLADRFGPLGFLARELLAEIPGLMAKLAPEPEPSQSNNPSR
jgi:hydroxyethylthiazole kinase-like uncharacterized protein yjeF